MNVLYRVQWLIWGVPITAQNQRERVISVMHRVKISDHIYYLLDQYHHRFLFNEKIYDQIALFPPLHDCERSNYPQTTSVLPEGGREDRLADGVRRVGCFDGRPDDLPVDGVERLPVLLLWDLTDWVEADRERLFWDSLRTDSICAGRTYRPRLSLQEKYRTVVPSKRIRHLSHWIWSKYQETFLLYSAIILSFGFIENHSNPITCQTRTINNGHSREIWTYHRRILFFQRMQWFQLLCRRLLPVDRAERKLSKPSLQQNERRGKINRRNWHD